MALFDPVREAAQALKLRGIGLCVHGALNLFEDPANPTEGVDVVFAAGKALRLDHPCVPALTRLHIHHSAATMAPSAPHCHPPAPQSAFFSTDGKRRGDDADFGTRAPEAAADRTIRDGQEQHGRGAFCG